MITDRINKQEAIGITDWTKGWGTHSSVTNVSPVIRVKTKYPLGKLADKWNTNNVLI